MAKTQAEQPLDVEFYGSVTVGERGQVVIPAEARKQYGIKPGDKLLAFRSPGGRGLVLVGVDHMRSMMSQMERWAKLVTALAGDDESREESGKE